MTTDTNIKPYININGTSKDSLRDENMKIFDKLTELHNALCQATPHGRDYKNAEDYQKARDEHYADRKTVAEMMGKYEMTLMHIVDA